MLQVGYLTQLKVTDLLSSSFGLTGGSSRGPPAADKCVFKQLELFLDGPVEPDYDVLLKFCMS
jgi:hypothetical protein